MIITISGIPGSGKSTLAKRLAASLGWKHYSAGDLRREMAASKGLTLEEFNKLGETDPSTDKLADERTKEIANTEDNFVMDGRLAFHFIPASVKIFVKADLSVCAKRIMDDARNVEKFSSLEKALSSLKKRMQSDTFRYQKYYGVDCYDESHYDYVIDSSVLTAEGCLKEALFIVRGVGNSEPSIQSAASNLKIVP